MKQTQAVSGPRSASLQLLRKLLLRLSLVMFGSALAFLIFEGVLHIFPALVPDGRAHNVNLGTIQYTTGMGDIFITRPGAVAPPDDPYKVLSQHALAWDADGFRIPWKPASHYEVIALGDSYTEGSNTAKPWPDVLAETSGLSVRNLGFRGYGPVEELRVLQDYGMKDNPRIVVLGFFEGNDLDDQIASRWKQEFVLPSIARKAFAPFDPNAGYWKSDQSGPFQFPVRVSINGKISDLAFLDSNLSILNGTVEDFEASDNVQSFAKTLAQMKAAVGPGTCFVMAYLPDSPHIYAPYVVPDNRAKLLSTVKNVQVKKPGEVITYDMLATSFEDVLTHLDNQHDVISGIAADQHIPFIDLLPPFKQAAAQGQILYYEYDTHWNEAGQTLAGQTIAAYLAQHPTPCVATP